VFCNENHTFNHYLIIFNGVTAMVIAYSNVSPELLFYSKVMLYNKLTWGKLQR